MKKILLFSLFFILLISNLVSAYTISVIGEKSFSFSDVRPAYPWIEPGSNMIQSSVWQNAVNLDFTLAARDITGANKVFMYFDYKTDYIAATISNTVVPKDHYDKRYIVEALDKLLLPKINSGLVGLINFDTVNTSNMFDSYLPVRYKTDPPSAYDYLGIPWSWTLQDGYSSKYPEGSTPEEIEDDSWRWVQDIGNATYAKFSYEYATIWSPQNTLGVLEWGIPPLFGFWTRYLPVHMKIAVPFGKRAGTYKGTIRVIIEAY
ncbi:hypothetical protein ACFL2K_01780 [Candidatus Margulisiibacteriota bacterium]